MISKWLDRLQAELDAIDPKDIPDPENEVNPETDHVVGIVPEHLRKLHFLSKQYKKEVLEFTLRGIKGGIIAIMTTLSSGGNSSQLKQKIEEEHAKIDGLKWKFIQGELMGDLFWIALREEFPELRTKAQLGVGRGYQVFWQDKDDEDNDEPDIVATITATRRPEPAAKPENALLRLFEKRKGFQA